jgi:leucyl-tRNA synthetase
MNQGQLLGPDGQRMSKSRGNVITPDSMVETYGADSLRLYLLFVAPFDQDIQWTEQGIQGARRFLTRVWNLYREAYPGSGSDQEEDAELERLLHRTIRAVSERIETFRFNTMVSALMEFANALLERQRRGAWRTRSFHRSLETFMVLMAPAAPHIAEELWRLTGHTGSVHEQNWPGWDEALAREETVQVAVQVDGRVREVIEVERSAGEAEIRELALAQPKVHQHLAGRAVRQVYYVPGRILNFVLER